MKKNKSKKDVQRIFLTKKRNLLKKNNKDAHLKISKQILKIEEFNKARIVASFISIKSEISMNSINDFIIRSPKKLCLPVMIKGYNHLIFRIFDNHSNLIKGPFGIYEPNEKSKELIPDFILTPCLAFDRLGYRIGYGGGYYDRTFNKFKKLKHPFISVAVAFDDQKVDKVVHDQYDHKIDYALTEKNIYKNK